MKYPILTRTSCSELAEQRLTTTSDWLNSPTDWLNIVNARSKWSGFGKDMSFDLICKAADEANNLAKKCHKTSYIDMTEGEAATHLYRALESVPIEILDDPGFWRYLSIAYFWDFIAWRERKPFGKGNHMKYLDCHNSKESVLTRMYLRVVAIGGYQYSELAYAIPEAVDFWRSHITRVKTGTVPPVSRAFVRSHAEDRLNTPQLREFAKLLNRKWANIVPYVYDDDDAEKLIAELRSSMPTSEQAD